MNGSQDLYDVMILMFVGFVVAAAMGSIILARMKKK